MTFVYEEEIKGGLKGDSDYLTCMTTIFVKTIYACYKESSYLG